MSIKDYQKLQAPKSKSMGSPSYSDPEYVGYADQDQTDDISTSIYKIGLSTQGYLYSLCCIPFCIFGAGPVVRVDEGHQATVLKYGKLSHIVGPGLYHRNIGSEEYVIKSVKLMTLDIPRQQVMTRDSVSVTLDAVCFYKINDMKRAVFNVSDSEAATRNLCQSALEQLIGEMTLEGLLSQRSKVAERLSEIIIGQTEMWGILVEGLEIRNVVLPESIQRTMAAVAEAQREGQAKVVMADAELRAADTFRKAASIMGQNPVALQLRYFQTLTEIAADNHSTMIVPSEVTSMFRALHTWTKDDESNPKLEQGGSGGGEGSEGREELLKRLEGLSPNDLVNLAKHFSANTK